MVDVIFSFLFLGFIVNSRTHYIARETVAEQLLLISEVGCRLLTYICGAVDIDTRVA